VHHSLAGLILGGMLAIPATEASAQRADTLPSRIVSANRSLEASELDAVKAFAATWGGRLADGAPSEVNQARSELISVARSPSATPIFLRAYGDAVIAEIQPVIAGSDTFRAINAMQAVRFLRTPDAVSLILDHADPDRETDASKRLVAAGLLASAITDAELNPAQLDGTTRRIASVAAAESEWMILLQSMEALDSIARLPNAPAASVALARRSQVSTLEGAISRMKGSPELVEAVYRTLLELRNQLVRMSARERGEFARQFGPVFASAEQAARSGLETAPPPMRPTFEKTAQQAQVLANLTRN
jgi:hypothetical protein